MENRQAGGRNTQEYTSAAEAALEAGLERVAGAVAALLADARQIDPERDEYRHARSRAYTDAVALLKASAKVGHTIAELRGTKFEHTINVNRQEPARPLFGVQEYDEAPEWGVLRYKGHDYNPNNPYSDGRVYIRGLGIMHVPDDWDEERWKAGLPQRGEEGIPLPISGGSNGNSGNSASAEQREKAVGPRIRSV